MYYQNHFKSRNVQPSALLMGCSRLLRFVTQALQDQPLSEAPPITAYLISKGHQLGLNKSL
jgi:hypothetical protein